MPGGLHWETRVPPKVARRDITARVSTHRLCLDDRVYAPIPFTIVGDVAVGDYPPMFPIDRNFWVAKVTAEIGKHDAGTHPADGTPGGQELRCNIRRVSANLSTDTALLGSESRLRVPADGHQDAISNGTDVDWARTDFNNNQLNAGEHIYVRVTQVGSTRPGKNLVVTVWLVPIRTPETA